MNIGPEIRKAAIDCDVRLQDVAKVAGLKYPYFSARLNGRKDFNTREISLIGVALGIPGSELLRRAEEAERAKQESA